VTWSLKMATRHVPAIQSSEPSAICGTRPSERSGTLREDRGARRCGTGVAIASCTLARPSAQRIAGAGQGRAECAERRQYPAEQQLRVLERVERHERQE
jgi:hypothetical protein